MIKSLASGHMASQWQDPHVSSLLSVSLLVPRDSVWKSWRSAILCLDDGILCFPSLADVVTFIDFYRREVRNEESTFEAT